MSGINCRAAEELWRDGAEIAHVEEHARAVVHGSHELLDLVAEHPAIAADQRLREANHAIQGSSELMRYHLQSPYGYLCWSPSRVH